MGILYAFDAGRDVFLTPARMTLVANKHGRAKNVYLRLSDGQASNVTGYRMSRPSVVTAISAQSRGTNPWTVHIRKNGSTTNLYSLNVSGGGAHNNLVDVRLDEGDTLQFYCEAASFFGINEPLIWIEVAGRLV